MPWSLEFTRICLALCGLTCALGAGTVALRFGIGETSAQLASGGMLAMAALFFGLTWRGSAETRATAVMIVVSTLIPTLLAELYIDRLLPDPITRLILAASRGEYDNRQEYDALSDLRRTEDPKAVPALWPALFLDRETLVIGGNRVQPLAGVSGRTTLTCNELGFWPTFKADEHGFTNPVGAWQGPIDIGMVGDSFGQGNCVEVPDSIAGRIRTHHPRLVNTAYGGNGPLLELAALKEYLAQVRPRRILWLYFEGNDLENMLDEVSSPLVASYLESGAVQSLWSRQAELDAALDAHLTARMRNPRKVGWTDVVLLRGLRMALGLGLVTPPPVPTHLPITDLEPFGRVMAEAKRTAAGWGGEIIVVYLPEVTRFTTPDKASPHHDAIIGMMSRLGLRTVDLLPVFTAHPDPLSLYSVRKGPHYSPEGYRQAAEAILATLDDGSQAR